MTDYELAEPRKNVQSGRISVAPAGNNGLSKTITFPAPRIGTSYKVNITVETFVVATGTIISCWVSSKTANDMKIEVRQATASGISATIANGYAISWETWD